MAAEIVLWIQVGLEQEKSSSGFDYVPRLSAQRTNKFAKHLSFRILY
jgi:hypothetical protein